MGVRDGCKNCTDPSGASRAGKVRRLHFEPKARRKIRRAKRKNASGKCDIYRSSNARKLKDISQLLATHPPTYPPTKPPQKGREGYPSTPRRGRDSRGPAANLCGAKIFRLSSVSRPPEGCGKGGGLLGGEAPRRGGHRIWGFACVGWWVGRGNARIVRRFPRISRDLEIKGKI